MKSIFAFILFAFSVFVMTSFDRANAKPVNKEQPVILLDGLSVRNYPGTDIAGLIACNAEKVKSFKPLRKEKPLPSPRAAFYLCVNPSKNMSGNSFIHLLGLGVETNPYYERWGRGRPSKESLAKRILSNDWEREQREKHPERYPFTNFLIKSLGSAPFVGNYQQR